MIKNEDNFYKVFVEKSSSTLKELKVFLIIFIVGALLGFLTAFYWPSPKSKKIENFSNRINSEKRVLETIKSTHAKEKIILEKKIIELKKKTAFLKPSNFKKKIATQSLIIKNQGKLINELKAENIDLYDLIEVKTKTQEAQNKLMSTYYANLMREENKNKILFSSTIGLAVTTAVSLAFGVGMVYLKK